MAGVRDALLSGGQSVSEALDDGGNTALHLLLLGVCSQQQHTAAQQQQRELITVSVVTVSVQEFFHPCITPVTACS